jgi:hypothetical protein
LTGQRPNYDQNPPLYPTALALIALYALIRTIGGQPADVEALATLFGVLLPLYRP